MDENHKNILLNSVKCDEFKNILAKLNEYKPPGLLLVKDENFFDYELLKAALAREDDPNIAISFLKFRFRARNPNKINCEDTPLHLAMKFDNENLIGYILKNGASIHDRNDKGETPLYAAFKEKYYNAIDILFDYYSWNDSIKQLSNLKSPDPSNEDDILHFHIACIRNNGQAVNVFLKHGIDVNATIRLDSAEYSGLTPLHYAAIKQYTELLKSLLRHGADISLLNDNGQTPLHILYSFAPYRTTEEDLFRAVFKHANSTKFINSTDCNGLSHFHLCCTLNYPSMVKVFINNGVDVNSATSLTCSKYPGFTPLHFAVLYNGEKNVKLLLENGADCNKVNEEGATPLHLACNSSSKSAARYIIEMLLKYNASVTIMNKKGRTPLHTAFYNFNGEETKIFTMLTSKIPRKVNFCDNADLSHFHIICTRSDVSTVKDFLKSGVKVNSSVAYGRYSGYTALHFAVLHKNKDVVELLLKWKARVNIKTTKLQVTPLHLICSGNALFYGIEYDKSGDLDVMSNSKNPIDIIKLLLLHGAVIDAQDSSGKTPLLHTCVYDEMFPFVQWSCHLKFDMYNYIFILKEVIQILLLNKADINAYTKSEKSILHIVIENEYLMKAYPFFEGLLEFLIRNGADINAPDSAGFTPLHAAVKFKRKLIIQILLNHKANVNAKSKNFKTPLSLIIDFYNESSSEESSIFLLLLENGSDVNTTDENNKTMWLNIMEKHSRSFDDQIYKLKMLLEYGVDINMEDLLGHPLIVPILAKWQLETEISVNESNANVFYIIFTHMHKLLAMGFYINEEVQKCCIALHDYYKSVLPPSNSFIRNSSDNISDNCTEELSRLKLIKVDNYNSLYNILLMDIHKLSKHVKNRTLLDIIMDRKIHDKFPLYSYSLKMKFKKAQRRYDILQEFADSSIFAVISLKKLPDPCFESIVKHFTNEEIVTTFMSLRKWDQIKNETKNL